MLAPSTHPRPSAVDPLPALTQGRRRVRAAIDSVANSAALEDLSIGLIPVGAIAIDLPLLSVKQLWQLRHVGHRRVGRRHAVDQALLVRPDVKLHPEVPGVSL